MIIEMVLARGTRIWIDGQKPNAAWGYGVGDGRITSKDLQNGDLRISIIAFDISIENIGSKDPKIIILETNKGTITANISDSNPNRLDLGVTIQVSGNNNITDIDLGFGFFFGTAQIL